MHRMALSQITWNDVQQLPDDGNRYEAIAGELHVTPAPTVRHQWISGELERSQYALVHDSAAGIVLHAQVGVEFPSTGEGVQPDIVVEILSPGTQRRERGVKLKLYDSQGVSECWIVDPVACAVDAWRFHGGAHCERHTDRLTVRLAGEVLGEIDLGPVFKEPGAAAP